MDLALPRLWLAGPAMIVAFLVSTTIVVHDPKRMGGNLAFLIWFIVVLLAFSVCIVFPSRIILISLLLCHRNFIVFRENRDMQVNPEAATEPRTPRCMAARAEYRDGKRS